MNLLFLFHFVFYQTAFGLVIGSPNLPVLGDGDVSGLFETTNFCCFKLHGDFLTIFKC